MTMPIAQQLEIIKRGCVELISDAELVKKLEEKRPLRVKAGFDPTAPDLHLGHTVLLHKMRQFQELGHQVIFLIGDFTARIGDPSGRSSTRPPLTEADIDTNMRTYEAQVFKILDREKTEVRFNSEWLGAMSVMEIVQLGSHYTVARMLERSDFKQRVADGTDVSVLEFYYPLFQAYDSVSLKADVELGGGDQKFNLLLGRTIQRRFGQPEQVVLMMPLLIGTDGVQKMSKSYGNHIGIQEPPGEMFGKLMSISDELMWNYYELLSSRSSTEIADLRAGHPKAAKVTLAKELVTRFHSAEAAEAAAAEFDRVFSRKQTPDTMPTLQISLQGEAPLLVDVIIQVDPNKSKGEVRRLIAQRAVKINDAVIEDIQYRISHATCIVQVGKRLFFKVVSV